MKPPEHRQRNKCCWSKNGKTVMAHLHGYPECALQDCWPGKMSCHKCCMHAFSGLQGEIKLLIQQQKEALKINMR